MSHSTVYRICLLVVVVLTIIGGIFYYINYVKKSTQITEGTLVMEDAGKAGDALYTAQNEETQESGGMTWLETQTLYI